MKSPCPIAPGDGKSPAEAGPSGGGDPKLHSRGSDDSIPNARSRKVGAGLLAIAIANGVRLA